MHSHIAPGTVHGTVLPEAWLLDQIARGQSWLHWTSLIYKIEFPEGSLVSGTLQSTGRAHKGETCGGFGTFWALIQSILDTFTAHIQQEVAPVISLADLSK